MKKILLSLLLLLSVNFLYSQSFRGTKEVTIYHLSGMGMLKHCLILKGSTYGSYDLFPGVHVYGIQGSFSISGDTLFLVPKYEYLGAKITEIDPQDISFLTVPQQFLVKGDSLMEVTNYKLYPSLASYDRIVRVIFTRKFTID